MAGTNQVGAKRIGTPHFAAYDVQVLGQRVVQDYHCKPCTNTPKSPIMGYVASGRSHAAMREVDL